jgi:hypothetical protein
MKFSFKVSAEAKMKMFTPGVNGRSRNELSELKRA